MYGRVDRGGSREGKGKSLRKNKIALVDATKKAATTKLDKDADPTSPPAPPLKNSSTANPETRETSSGADDGAVVSLLDGGCNLVSRRFESDQSRVIQRALKAGIEALVVLTNDYEQQEAITKLTQEHSGFIYGCVGIHPDNVKRTNEKLFSQRVEQLREAARHPEAVAIFCGLDFSREIATRYAQERLFQNHLELAAEVKLPVLFTDTDATEKLVEMLREFGDDLPAAAVFNFGGTASELDAYLSIDNTKLYFIITGMVCDPETPRAQEVLDLLPRIPKDRLLLASYSPKYTPQNIEDPYIRKQKNEPSNLPYVLDVVAKALKSSRGEVAKDVRENTMALFGLREPVPEEDVETEESVEAEEEETEAQEEDVEEAEEAEEDAEGDGEEDEEEGEEDDNQATGQKKKGASIPKDVHFACMLCRTTLFGGKDAIPHEKGLDSLKELATGSGDGKNKRARARNDIEFDSANVIFVRERPWMKEKSDAERLQHTKAKIVDGKLDCPKCGAKAIGRWLLTTSGVVYTMKKKRMDTILEGADLHSLDAKLATRLQQDEGVRKKGRRAKHQQLNDEENQEGDGDDDEDEEEEEEEDQTNKKKRKKARRRKQQKATNTSNMGNFRNKSYGFKAPSSNQSQSQQQKEEPKEAEKEEKKPSAKGGRRRQRKGQAPADESDE